MDYSDFLPFLVLSQLVYSDAGPHFYYKYFLKDSLKKESLSFPDSLHVSNQCPSPVLPLSLFLLFHFHLVAFQILSLLFISTAVNTSLLHTCPCTILHSARCNPTKVWFSLWCSLAQRHNQFLIGDSFRSMIDTVILKTSSSLLLSTFPVLALMTWRRDFPIPPARHPHKEHTISVHTAGTHLPFFLQIQVKT